MLNSKPFKIKHQVVLFLNPLLATSKAFLQAAPILQLPNLILAQTYLSTLPNLATKILGNRHKQLKEFHETNRKTNNAIRSASDSSLAERVVLEPEGPQFSGGCKFQCGSWILVALLCTGQSYYD